MIFISGGTGFIGSYVVSRLLETTDHKLAILTRSADDQAAIEKLYKSLQLHMDQEKFDTYVKDRFFIAKGDLTQKHLGLSDNDQKFLHENITSIIHCAASLNRKSETKCAQVNLMGSLHMVELAKACSQIIRFSFVSTVAVAGTRQDEVVLEDTSIDWNRKDYDPYARTKKFCEEFITSSLSHLETIIFRPSIVLGDSRMGETTQFDMAYAFVKLSKFKILPFKKTMRLDIVPANYVGYSIADIHTKEKPKYSIYHLSSGESAVTYGEVSKLLSNEKMTGGSLFIPILLSPFYGIVNFFNFLPRSWGLYKAGALMKVFLPYLHFNTVFDNNRVVEEVGHKPARFTEYCIEFYQFLNKHGFRYPYQPYDKDKAS